MTTRSRGFTLIELLVVVAILGILAAVGIVAYSGYVESAKRKSAVNIMMQVALAQTEYYTENSSYLSTHGSKCTPNGASSNSIESGLLEDADLITDDIGYNFCIYLQSSSAKKFIVVGEKDTSDAAERAKSRITVDGNQTACTESCTD